MFTIKITSENNDVYDHNLWTIFIILVVWYYKSIVDKLIKNNSWII